jgi:cytoskeletal protein CcmA (bactofilin family)
MLNRESAVKNGETGELRSLQPARPGEERRVVVWVGKSVIFKGTLISSEDMAIDGHVEGTIEVRDQALTVGPDADIHADIVAKIVTIHGAVTGTIRASAKIEIRETGSVDGDLVSPCVVIADGAVVRGRIDTLTDHAEATPSRPPLAIVNS